MKLAWERDPAAGRRMVVQGLLPAGPADTAGVKPGDEILGVAGEAVLGKVSRGLLCLCRLKRKVYPCCPRPSCLQARSELVGV